MNKNNIDLTGFDFGFSVVDEQELEAVQKVQTAAAASDSSSKEWQAQADEWKSKAEAMYAAFMPLLDNLASNEDKEYIYWPNRKAIIQSQIDRLQKITQKT